VKRILVVAPHPDDEILGVGATIAKYAEEGESEVTVLTVSGHLPPLYPIGAYERTVEEARLAHQLVGVHDSFFLEIPATMLGDVPVHQLNAQISEVVERVAPQMVLCPYPDRHVDHRLVFESVMVATRPVGGSKNIELIAAYETLSETHWNAPHIEPNFTPNWIVDVTEHYDTKERALSQFKSQIPAFPGPRSLKALRSLAVFRGTQAGFAHGEALHVIRMRT
jgi:N-acetylglucosamine malate deacetylase 1